MQLKNERENSMRKRSHPLERFGITVSLLLTEFSPLLLWGPLSCWGLGNLPFWFVLVRALFLKWYQLFSKLSALCTLYWQKLCESFFPKAVNQLYLGLILAVEIVCVICAMFKPFIVYFFIVKIDHCSAHLYFLFSFLALTAVSGSFQAKDQVWAEAVTYTTAEVMLVP